MSIQSFRLKVRISKGPASPGRPLQQSVWCGALPRSGTDAQLNSGLGKKSDRPEAWVDKHLRCSEVVVRERGPAEGALPLCGGCESPAGLEVVVRSYALSGFDAFVTDSQDQLGQQLGLCCHLIGFQGVHIKAPCTLMKPIRLPILQIFILRWARLSLTSCWEVFPHQEREGSVMRTGNRSSLDLIWLKSIEGVMKTDANISFELFQSIKSILI